MLIENDPVTNRYKLLIDSVDGIVWEADPVSLRFTFVSESASGILGYPSKEWLIDRSFWIDHIYHEDLGYVKEYYRDLEALGNHTIDFRMIRPDGSLVSIRNHVSAIYEKGKLVTLCGVMMDITKKKLLESLELLEKQVFELNAEPNADTERVLKFYVTGLEHIFPEMKCTVLRIENNKAYNWVSPSLPAVYVEAINGFAIGPVAGSCGTAAYYGKRVIVSDIEHDEKWADFKGLALPNGLRACWSQPVIDTQGKVMATFAMYYDKVKEPDDAELAIIERSAAILRVILENKLYAATIMEMNSMAILGEELANFGTWQWDFNSNTAKWSDTLCRIFGEEPGTVEPTYELYLSKVHPEDRERVRSMLGEAHRTKSDVTFDERIIRPDGSIRDLRSWFRVMTDDSGRPVKFIGSSLDITRIKENENRMRNIAWLQSHMVRAPLARIMGLVNLLRDGTISTDTEKSEFYSAIINSANELDGVIRSITYHARDDNE